MMFPVSSPEVKVNMRGKFLKTKQAYLVYVTFAVTIDVPETHFIQPAAGFFRTEFCIGMFEVRLEVVALRNYGDLPRDSATKVDNVVHLFAVDGYG